MIGRIVRSEDFEQALRRPPRLKSVHFSLHHARDQVKVTAHNIEAVELSTGGLDVVAPPVDDLDEAASAQAGPVPAVRFGLVVPKRHARRAVTRNLLRRQMRAAADRHLGSAEAGCWVLRLRAPFARDVFRSAASEVLRRASQAELESLFGALHAPGGSRRDRSTARRTRAEPAADGGGASARD